MPLANYSLEAIKYAMSMVEEDPRATKKILTLSCPDIIARREKLVELFGQRVASLPARQDSTDIIGWHKAQNVTYEVIDTFDLFKAIGYELTCVDQVKGRGHEIIHDLNNPLPWEYDDKFDIVFDCISNQVFNVATCWASMFNAVRVGGFVISVTPMSRINQGFWSVSPTAYGDFAEANGFTLVHTIVEGINWEEDRHILKPLHKRIKAYSDDDMNFAVLRKDKKMPITWPNMTKFKINPHCLQNKETT